MRLNHHLGELVSNFDEYGEYLYWFSVMGKPSESESWGWRLDGHHLIINYFVLGDQLVMTPTFMGSEPVEAPSGKYAGISILQPDQARGLQLMQALPPEQQKLVRIGPKKGRAESRTGRRVGRPDVRPEPPQRSYRSPPSRAITLGRVPTGSPNSLPSRPGTGSPFCRSLPRVSQSTASG